MARLQEKRFALASLDLLASLVAHDEIGLPSEPRSVLIPGEWRDGVSSGDPVR